jgi:hypothetical protein
VLVFATEEPLTDNEKRALEDVRAMGAAARRPGVPIGAALVPSGPELLVGSVSLISLYSFLKAYRSAIGDLDQLYEKNVRRFLGTGGRVNRAMLLTLRDAPERFGLYNNGITLVVRDFEQDENGVTTLAEPYVVNGCQTTRTIWEVFHRRLDAGGTGTNPELEDWRRRAAEGVVVTKIVKVGAADEDLLLTITRYTNTQNAVREKDFLALTSDFRTWASQMAQRYGIFLEIQRGGWDSQRAQQRQQPSAQQFTESANAFDLLKVYGAGWMGEAGAAFGRNASFLPNGAVFKRIMASDEGILSVIRGTAPAGALGHPERGGLKPTRVVIPLPCGSQRPPRSAA